MILLAILILLIIVAASEKAEGVLADESRADN